MNREDFNSLLQVGIVQEIVEGDSEEIIYRHQSFQEYFASLELKEKILTDSGINCDAITNHLEYMYWDNVWQFLLGSLKVESAKELIEYIKEYDILLAGRCLAESEANIENIKTFIDELFVQISDKKVVEVLVNIPEPRNIDRFMDILKDKNSDIRIDAAFALGDIRSEKAVNPLIKLLADKDPYARSGAAWALGNIRPEKAVDSLIGLLADADAGVRKNAAWALQNISTKLSQSAQDKLVIRLANRNDKDSREVLERIKKSTGRRFIKVLEGKKS